MITLLCSDIKGVVMTVWFIFVYLCHTFCCDFTKLLVNENWPHLWVKKICLTSITLTLKTTTIIFLESVMLYLLLMFYEFIFMRHSIWWQCPTTAWIFIKYKTKLPNKVSYHSSSPSSFITGVQSTQQRFRPGGGSYFPYILLNAIDILTTCKVIIKGLVLSFFFCFVFGNKNIRLQWPSLGFCNFSTKRQN